MGSTSVVEYLLVMVNPEIRQGAPGATESLKPGYVKKAFPFPLEYVVAKTSLPVNLDDIKSGSHRRDGAWIGWQVNRKARGTAELTGFEPYFIGSDFQPAEIGEKLNQVGARILKPLSTNRRREVMQTISDGNPSFDALLYLYAQFSATLAGFRAGIAQRPEALRYRSETADLCETLKVLYPRSEANVRIHALPSRVHLPPEVAKPAVLDVTGYDLMVRIGKVGDPLLWKMLAVPSDTEIAQRYNRFAFG